MFPEPDINSDENPANGASTPAPTAELTPAPTAEPAAEPAAELTAEPTAEPAPVSDAHSASVVAPAPRVAEAPAAFLRLKEYCDGLKLKAQIDLEEPLPNVSIEFRNGRETRTVYVGMEDAAQELTQYPLDELVFLGEYSAICSYKGGWIEAAVRPHGLLAGRNVVARRSIFGPSAGSDPEAPREIEISDTGGVILRLTEKRGCLHLLDYSAPMYLRIEGIGITEHDAATNLLEDLSNSLFLQIDFRFDSALTIPKGSVRRLPRPRGKVDEESQLTFPRFTYERNPSSLYWYARSATFMPLLQFLSFYQCIEFFFPHYSRQETIARIKNILKSPLFDGTKDSSINMIVNATVEGHRAALLEERKQLTATLKHCVDAVELRNFLNETESRKRYYAKDYKSISEKRIVVSDDASIIEQTAERIYDIRCKVVHTKNLDAGEGNEMILPFTREESLLVDDVELIKFLARKVLIAASIPLNI